MKILIIDDSKTARSLLKMHLNKLGHEDIREVENGREGFDILEKESNINLVLLDRVMPEMDGIQFLKRLKENDIYQSVKVAMITGEPDEQAKMQALIDYNADFYLEKPVSSTSLVRMFTQLSRPGS